MSRKLYGNNYIRNNFLRKKIAHPAFTFVSSKKKIIEI